MPRKRKKSFTGSSQLAAIGLNSSGNAAKAVRKNKKKLKRK